MNIADGGIEALARLSGKGSGQAERRTEAGARAPEIPSLLSSKSGFPSCGHRSGVPLAERGLRGVPLGGFSLSYLDYIAVNVEGVMGDG